MSGAVFGASVALWLFVPYEELSISTVFEDSEAVAAMELTVYAICMGISTQIQAALFKDDIYRARRPGCHRAGETHMELHQVARRFTEEHNARFAVFSRDDSSTESDPVSLCDTESVAAHKKSPDGRNECNLQCELD